MRAPEHGEIWKTMACPRMQTSPRGDFSALMLVNWTREAKRRPRPKYAVTPELQTANRLSYERPVRSSRPRPQNTICYSPAGPGVGRSSTDPDLVEVSHALCQIR